MLGDLPVAIDLLNMAYKDLAKTNSARVWRLLPNITQDTETSFVQEHSILDNIFTFTEAT